MQVCTCCASVCVQVLELGSAYRCSPSSWKCLDLTDKYLKDRWCRTGKSSPVTHAMGSKNVSSARMNDIFVLHSQ